MAFADAFNNSSIDLKLYCWINNPREWRLVKSEVMKQVLALFREKGIQIPFPQRDLHIYNHPENPMDTGTSFGRQ